MENLSHFLAKLLGLYFIIIGVALFLNKERFQSAVEDIKKSPALMLFNAALPLIFGLLIVLSHNVWVAAWPVLVTLVGWLALIQGLIRLFCPEKSLQYASNLMQGNGSAITAAVLVILGVILAYLGFWN